MDDRFFSKVRITPGCWIWEASTTPNGYGKFGIRYRTMAAHRVSYEMAHGPIPSGMVVRHRCDNKLCVNPEHLLVGTQADNIADMHLRGRWCDRRGSKHPLSRLTDEQVLEIRGSHEPASVAAVKYGVDESHIRKIRSGKAWRNALCSL